MWPGNSSCFGFQISPKLSRIWIHILIKPDLNLGSFIRKHHRSIFPNTGRDSGGGQANKILFVDNSIKICIFDWVIKNWSKNNVLEDNCNIFLTTFCMSIKWCSFVLLFQSEKSDFISSLFLNSDTVGTQIPNICVPDSSEYWTLTYPVFKWYKVLVGWLDRSNFGQIFWTLWLLLKNPTLNSWLSLTISILGLSGSRIPTFWKRCSTLCL